MKAVRNFFWYLYVIVCFVLMALIFYACLLFDPAEELYPPDVHV